MSTATAATCDEVATHHDVDASQPVQDTETQTVMSNLVIEEHCDSGSTLDTSVAAQPAPAKETTETHVDTHQPKDGLKRQGGTQREEQEATKKRQKLNEHVPAPLLEAKAIAAATAQVHHNAQHERAVENGRLMCLQLCAKLHTTLSRELRDMVYSAIIGPYDREIVTGHKTQRTGALKTPKLDICNHEMHRLKPAQRSDLRWWLDSYMGRQVATEIVEHWYRSRTFCFSHRRAGLIPDFVEQDVFSKGLEPGRFIQHIHAHLDESHTYSSHFDELKMWLGKIKNKDVNLYIRLPSFVQMWARRLQLEMLGPMVYQLRKEGLSRITVQSSGAIKDFTFLFSVPETLFKDQLAQWAATANPNF